MKKVLSLLLTVLMCISMLGTAFAAEFKFTDVNTGDWFYNDVKTAVESGLVNGKSETTYAPYDNLTYAEAIKLAACMNQLYTEGKITLTSGNPWYQPYVDYCKINNIIKKDYDYNANATRSGYIEIFASALPDSAFEEINNIPNGSILDVKSGATYAHYVYKMYRAGILTGVDALHNCKPDDNIKRSEVAAIISRMMNDDNRVEFEIIEKIDNKGEIVEDEDDDENNQTVKYEQPDVEEPGKDNQKTESPDDPVYVEPETPEVTDKTPTQPVTPGYEIVPSIPYDGGSQEYIQDTPLTIHKQPEGLDSVEYGTKYELEVQVFGGKAPYTYEWQYNGYRNQKTKIENGDYVKDADSATLILSIEKENTLLGTAISCKITDSEGTTVTTDAVKVYGPFSMPVDESLNDSGNNVLTGRVADGILKKGEKVSVIRNGKVIAIGVAEDLQMFNKSMDETAKSDNVGIVFARENGVRPVSGDIVVKYQPTHVVDTSDIVN